jgi:hypothetical protein
MLDLVLDLREVIVLVGIPNSTITSIDILMLSDVLEILLPSAQGPVPKESRWK